ncbi:MAG: homoserine dehydrogenase [Dehalococcoidia bacterium]|nr:homoserine dehydrogenase [Dehalococcoidia bacterium]MSQ17449.1 homoserine dehydrogenase [Dehalococcoidia bacterium]
MRSTQEIKVGLLGLGVVGGGVAATLLGQGDALSRKIGRRLVLEKILVRDPAKARPADVPAALITTNPEEILADPQIQVVVEVMGGAQPANRYLQDALSAGKHVVTANKEVMAKHGPELLALAQQRRVHLLFEASVGGGIPIVGCLTNQLLANDIRSVRSIINGTTNYILTRMAHQHTDFPVALKEAQERGYAEADPTNDVEGIDASYKLSVLAYLAFHQRVPPENIYREGISRLQAQDFRYAQELGYAIKSLAIATLEGGAIQARVYPALVPLDNMLAKVDGVYNAVEVDGNLCGRVLFHGRGAGREPTTSAVVGDLVEIARRMDGAGPLPPVAALERPWPIRPIGDLRSRYYLRLTVADRPGVLAQIAHILGERLISIAAVVQKDTNLAEQTAELVITTHSAQEASVQQALREMTGLSVVRRVNNLIRIEE